MSAEYKRGVEFSLEVVEWAAKLARALNEVGTSAQTTHGTYDLADIPILFEGEETGLALLGSEFGESHTLGTRECTR